MIEATSYILLIVIVIQGYFKFGNIFNYLTLFTTFWGLEIFLYHLNLLGYRNISNETWLFINTTFVAIIASNIIFRNTNLKSLKLIKKTDKYDIKHIKIVIYILIGVSTIGVLQHWLYLLSQYGSLQGIFSNFHHIYKARIADELDYIPYLSSAAYSALFFSAYYFDELKKDYFAKFTPITLVFLEAFAQAGRAHILIGLFLFFNCVSLKNVNKPNSYFLKKYIRTVLFLLVTLVLLFEVMRVYRGVNEEKYKTTSVYKATEAIPFITPSIYLYSSANIVVFDKYVHYKYYGKNEEYYFGENTFGIVFRFLHKFDITKQTKIYTQFYTVPFESNTGTWLIDYVRDFGYFGTILFIFVISSLNLIFIQSSFKNVNLYQLTIVAIIATAFCFSFFSDTIKFSFLTLTIFFNFTSLLIIDNLRMKK